MDIQSNIKIKATPMQLYEACSSQKGIEGWWCKNSDVAEKEGGISKLVFDKEGTLVHMEFRTDKLQAHSKVIWTCVSNDNPTWIGTSLNFEISGNEHECLVELNHSGFKDESSTVEMEKTIADTWAFFMNSLKSYCETKIGQPW